MSDAPTVPVTADFTPFDPSSTHEQVAAAIKEIEAAGVTVTGVYYAARDAPPKFFIKFTGAEPQWTVRAKLEAKLYDVGQKLGQNELAFYVTKRVEKTKGWAT